jgi:enolase
MRLIIVRHGESEWNKLNLFTGFKNVDLTDHGVQEAKNAGKNIETNIDVAFTSILDRARNTCKIIKDELNQDFEIIENEALNERDYGDLTGQNKEALAKKFGEEQVYLWRRSVNVRPPNGENLLDVIERVSEYFNNVIKPHLESKNVLIVAHGNSIRALLCILGVFSLDEINRFEIPTAKPMFIQTRNPKDFFFKNDYVFVPRQILDSRGNPTIEVEMYLGDDMLGTGTAPSGASTGSNEAVELRDNNSSFMGKSVYDALLNILMMNMKMYLDHDTLCNLKKCDNQMILIDGTELKKKFGGNVTTALSFLFADVGANLMKKQLFEYLKYSFEYNHSYRMPIPMVNILNGGKHAGGNLKIQEFMIMPTDDVSFMKRTEYVFIIYNNLKKILKQTYGPSSINLGDEGGFAPNLNTADEALDMIEKAVEISNLKMGKDIFLALDCAASEYYDNQTKLYEIEVDKFINSNQLIEYYLELMNRHPGIKSIEDPFDEKDYEAWQKFTSICDNKIMVVGDDLFTTNPNLVKKGMTEGWANSLLLKVNQIGTITEAVEAAKLMQDKSCDVIVSHRSGETNNSLISDLAVGINAKYIKLGAPARGERVAKYNRLIKIEEFI